MVAATVGSPVSPHQHGDEVLRIPPGVDLQEGTAGQGHQHGDEVLGHELRRVELYKVHATRTSTAHSSLDVRPASSQPVLELPPTGPRAWPRQLSVHPRQLSLYLHDDCQAKADDQAG